jgi:hypothetical protein
MRSNCAWNQDVHEKFHKFKILSLPWVISECIDYNYQLDLGYCSKCSYRLLPDIFKNVRYSPLAFPEDTLVDLYKIGEAHNHPRIVVYDYAPVAMIINHTIDTDQERMVELIKQASRNWKDEPVFNELPNGTKCTACSPNNRGLFTMSEDGVDVSQCPLMKRILMDMKRRFSDDYAVHASVSFAAYLYPYLSVLPRRWRLSKDDVMQTLLLNAFNVVSNLKPSETLRRILSMYKEVLQINRMSNKFVEILAYPPHHSHTYRLVAREDCPVVVYRVDGNEVVAFDREYIEWSLQELENAILCGEVTK